jgi:hypothetical protein
MAFLVHNLPPVHVWVRKEYLYDHQEGHGELTPGIWVSCRYPLLYQVKMLQVICL